MKTRIVIIFSLVYFSFLQIYAQECISIFVEDIQKQSFNLKINEKKAVKQFMKVGYKVHLNYKLQDTNVIAKPIYSIFKKKHYPQKMNDIRNILCYLDTKRLYIDEIYFYKDSVFYGSADGAYSNYPDQVIGKSDFGVKLASIILKENPDLIFTIGQTNGYYLFFKNNQLNVYSMFYNKEKKFIKYEIDDFINNYMDEFDLIIGTDYSPPIYCR